jgi:hypothetical protein
MAGSVDSTLTRAKRSTSRPIPDDVDVRVGEDTMRMRAVAATLVLCWAWDAGLQGQNAEQRRVLNLATLYVHRFIDAYTNVVAEETYVQETTSPRRTRTLKSDYSLVRFPGAIMWQGFRDVFEVDGRAVQDSGREARLAQLFVEVPENAMRRIDEIDRASVRYNIADIGTLNNPLRVIAYLQEQYRSRFRFTFSGIEKDLGPTVRTVRFEEFQRPTLLRTGGGADFTSHGLIWIDEPTGRIVKTELRPGRFQNPSTIITTTFRFDETLGIDVPGEMRDRYPDRTGEVRGVATYGRFRRFNVRTDAAVDTPDAPR